MRRTQIILGTLLVAILLVLGACAPAVVPSPPPAPAPALAPTPTPTPEPSPTPEPTPAPTPEPEPTSVVVPSMRTQVTVAVPSIHNIADLNGKKLGMNASAFQYALAALDAYSIECIPVAIPSSEEFEALVPQKIPSLEDFKLANYNPWLIAPESIKSGTALPVPGRPDETMVFASTPEQQQEKHEAQQKALSLLQSKALIEPGGGIKREAFEQAIRDTEIRQALYDVGLSGKQVSEGMEFVKTQKFWLGLQYEIYDAVLIGNHPSSELQDMLNSASVQILPWGDQAIQALTDQFPEVAATVLPANTYHNQDSDILGFTIYQ